MPSIPRRLNRVLHNRRVVGPESARFESGSGDVVGEVGKPMAEPRRCLIAVDGLGRAVAGAGAVEVASAHRPLHL